MFHCIFDKIQMLLADWGGTLNNTLRKGSKRDPLEDFRALNNAYTVVAQFNIFGSDIPKNTC